MPASARAASLALAQRAAALCVDAKATDVVLLDVHGVSDLADCFLIASVLRRGNVLPQRVHVASRAWFV